MASKKKKKTPVHPYPLFFEEFQHKEQPRPQSFSLKKWVGPFFKGKALGTRLHKELM